MAAAFAPAAAQVGLQLLLQPYSSGIGDIACIAVGTVYPAYASFKAVEIIHLRGEPEEAARWLTYWGVYGILSVFERLVDRAGLPKWLPYYSALKLALLLWLQIPRFAGARRLSSQFVRPSLRNIHPHIDHAVDSICHAVTRPELVAFGEMIQHAMARVPLLEWFVRLPDGRPLPPPSSGRGGGFISSSR